MRERTKVLYEAGDDGAARDRSFTIDISKFQFLRIYCGYSNDGYTITEVPLFDDMFPIENWAWLWTFYWGGGTPGAIGSMRFNGFRREENSNTYTVNLSRLTYLNGGTSEYSETANNTWGPAPIYKIVGIYKDGVSE